MKKHNKPRLLCTSIAALMVSLPAWQAAQAQTEPQAATDAAYSIVENPPAAQQADTALNAAVAASAEATTAAADATAATASAISEADATAESAVAAAAGNTPEQEAEALNTAAAEVAAAGGEQATAAASGAAAAGAAAATLSAEAAEAATAPQENTLQRLKRWLQPISSKGVRADVLARALTATTSNDQGQQVAVPWTQAMPGGAQQYGTGHPDMQLEQNQLEEGKLQLIAHKHQDTRNLELDLQQLRIEVPYTLPSGALDTQKWSKPGTPLLSVGKSAFSILEFRRSGSIDFRRRHSALTEAASDLVLKQGDRIEFNQVILDWNTGGGPNQFHQLMVLKGEQYDQFRVCINALGIMYRQLVCNVWQVPGNYWRRPQNLQYVGSYLVDEAGGNRYWRYKGQ